MSSQQFSLSFLKKDQIAKDTFSFYFKRPATYDFLPGQYNKITLPITVADGLGASRDFTIASSPLEKEYLMITTKISQSDFKKVLFALKPGEQVQFYGPIGGFVLQDTDTFEHVFLAGGIGITVFQSMITYVARKNLPIPITLFASFSTIEEIVYYDELVDVSKKQENIKIIYTVTHPQDSKEKWKRETGRISETLLKKYITDISQPTYHIAGSPKMVEETEELLESMRIKEGKIKIDQFTGY